MRELIRIENIEEMRRQEGIDDVELREDIRQLAVADLVRLTFLTGTNPPAGETLTVRITSIRGHSLRGKLISKPASAGLSELRVGMPVLFTTEHIHSIPGGRPTQQT
jgi:hypothetical protein